MLLKEKIYQDIIRDKTREVMNLKERISEQKMLIKILEDKLYTFERTRSAKTNIR